MCVQYFKNPTTLFSLTKVCSLSIAVSRSRRAHSFCCNTNSLYNLCMRGDRSVCSVERAETRVGTGGGVSFHFCDWMV